MKTIESISKLMLFIWLDNTPLRGGVRYEYYYHLIMRGLFNHSPVYCKLSISIFIKSTATTQESLMFSPFSLPHL